MPMHGKENLKICTFFPVYSILSYPSFVYDKNITANPTVFREKNEDILLVYTKSTDPE